MIGVGIEADKIDVRIARVVVGGVCAVVRPIDPNQVMEFFGVGKIVE